jgi:hypothetical protein
MRCETSCMVQQLTAVAAGDFNSNVQWDAKRPGGNHTEVARLFDSHGLISAYHAHHEERQGAETRPPITFTARRASPSTSTTYLSERLEGEISRSWVVPRMGTSQRPCPGTG